MLPQHIADVLAIVEAALQLETALAAEADLRDSLTENGASYSGQIHPMPFWGVGLLSDSESRISKYFAECAEFGFLRPDELPDIVRDRLPKKEAAPKAPARITIE